MHAHLAGLASTHCPDEAPAMADLLLELTRRYTEPHRHYHGLPHIAAMLAAGRTFPLDPVQSKRPTDLPAAA
jgi:predicted metal-dependent HD superfamily phosphohydrolase